MTDKRYLSFYNQIKNQNMHPITLIHAYGNYICSHYEQVKEAYIGFLESGSYHLGKIDCGDIVDTLHPASMLKDSIKQMTYDIYKDMYSLEDILVLDHVFTSGFPYVVPAKLSEFFIGHHIDGPLLLLHLFYDGILIGDLFFTLGDNDNQDHDDLINELTFIRHNLETLLWPLLSRENSNQILSFLDVTESLLNSKHYQTSDTSGFMARLLDIVFESTNEPDYGSALLFEEGFWTYTHAIGHDRDKLMSIRIPDRAFSTSLSTLDELQEVSPKIFIIDEILENKSQSIDDYSLAIFKTIQDASMPIEKTIQLYIYLEGRLKGVLSLDIKKGSDKTFTNKTIDTLKRLRLLGQVLFTYSTMISKSESFEKLTVLISKLLVVEGTQIDFMKDFLKLLVENLFEVKYASAYLRDSSGIHFLEAIGHDLKGLQNLRLKPDYFVSAEVIKANNILKEKQYNVNPNLSATLLSDLLKFAKNTMPDDVYQEYERVNKPIKDGLIAQIHLEKDVYMYISCDIPLRSPLTFSEDTIHLFSILTNLGFSFISNQYFIDKYKKLNQELETIIKDRTDALRKSNAKLRALVERDSMTGLYNHKSIIKSLEKALEQDQDVSIFLFDIDFFKKVNDTFGHQVGDLVLVRISEMLLEDPDVKAGRYGGEEFMLIIRNTDLPEAITYCQRILTRISKYPFIEGHTVTISGGVVTGNSTTASKMIRTADTLLYEAKNGGRNQLKYNYSIN